MGNVQKPSTYLNWTDGSPSKVVQPPAPQLASGWTASERSPFQYMNWLFWLTDQWIQYLDQGSDQEISELEINQALRLLNGGSWTFNASTGVLAWSSAFNLAIPSIADADNQAAAGSVTLTDGQVAYVAANLPFTTTANTTNGSNVLTSVAYESGISIGQAITGTGIPGGTTVTAIDTTANTVTMSANATADGSAVNLTFSGSGALTVVAATSSSLLLSPNTIILARRVGNKVYVGTNAIYMVLRDGESKLLSENGYLAVYAGTAGENLTAGQAVYISTGTGGDSGRTAGRVYKCDTSVTNGLARSVFLGFVMTSATTGNPVNVVTDGVMGGFSTLTAGVVYYADPSTPGAVTATKPTVSGQYIAPVGIALSSTTIDINPSGAADVVVVTTPNAWPNYFCAQESDLTTAIASAISNGGGVISLLNSFTVASAHTIPSGTILQGRAGGSILTITSSGAITLADNACMRDVWFTTALTSGSLLTLSGNYCRVRDCQFTIPSAGTGNCILVSGNANKMYNNTFIGVSGSTGPAWGINYSAGVDNADYDSVFLP